MDERAVQPLLLSNGGRVEFVHTKKSSLFLSSLKWILKIAMWLLFITWVVLIFLYPINTVNEYINVLIDDSTDSFLGISGPMFLIFSGPILLISFLGVPYLVICRKEQLQEKDSPKSPGYSLSTFPVIVDGPFGVVTAAELVGILLFAFYIIWAVIFYAIRGVQVASQASISFTFQVAGVSFAFIGIFLFAFLFIPVTRGSILLRLIDVPCGHAARYHAWLAHLTVSVFLLHGLCYITVWILEGVLLFEITEWQSTGVSNLSGVITLWVLILIWVTSLPQVRKYYFEVFMCTHQLYVLFIIFLAMHVGVIPFSIVSGAILLFMLDRFLRFWQSRRVTEIISATYFPSGIVKLDLAKPRNLQCKAFSFIFLQLPGVSRLQWHPFSVSLSGEHYLSVLVRAVGGWTTKVKENISNICVAESQQERHDLQSLTKMITASVEGPYGHELLHHLMYEKLILVSGGIGISPFLAVLSDSLHRSRQGKPCLIKNVLVVWAVKRSNELSLLSTIDKKFISTNDIYNELNLDILIYVTQESEPPVEEGREDKGKNSFVCPVSSGSRGSISTLTGTTNDLCFGIYIISTAVGFFALWCLLNKFYVVPYGIPTGWYQGLLYVVCMVASVIFIGGPVISIWHLQERKFLQQDAGQRSDITQYNESAAYEDFNHDLASSTKIRYGSRPDFKDIFESLSEKWSYTDVGVVVCGPPTLVTSVARECRSLNMRKQQDHPIFHFHSHSFSW